MEGRTWREGYWPLDQDVEEYLKSRILVAEPNAKFFYSAGFRTQCEQADAARKQEAERAKPARPTNGRKIGPHVPRDLAGRPMSARLVAYWQRRGFFEDEEST